MDEVDVAVELVLTEALEETTAFDEEEWEDEAVLVALDTEPVWDGDTVADEVAAVVVAEADVAVAAQEQTAAAEVKTSTAVSPQATKTHDSAALWMAADEAELHWQS